MLQMTEYFLQNEARLSASAGCLDTSLLYCDEACHKLRHQEQTETEFTQRQERTTTGVCVCVCVCVCETASNTSLSEDSSDAGLPW